MPESFDGRDYLTTTQAAKLLSVSPDTVLKWVKAGKIKSYRTLGGHCRIPRSELAARLPDQGATTGLPEMALHPLTYQYCWEYLAADGEISPDCKECITYRSRTRRCYELRDLPEGLGCLRVYCKSSCEECNYYHMVKEQGLNIILLGPNRRLFRDWDMGDNLNGVQIRYAENEYECSVLVEQFRPDYIVVDCSFGRRRTGLVCSNIFNDVRIPVARIILASKTRKLKEYCDREVCGWITKPFTWQQLKDCIDGAQLPAGSGNEAVPDDLNQSL